MKVCPAHSSITFNTNASATKSLIFTEITILRRQERHTFNTSNNNNNNNNNLILILHAFHEMIKRALHDFYL